MSTRTAPQHGERRCYLRGCRRPECRAANYRYMSKLRLERQRGQRRRTCIKHVTDHVQNLIDAGWTQAQIERATGVGHRSIAPILAGSQPNVGVRTEQRLLALPVGPPPCDARDIDATGTRRRIQALVAIGYNYPTLGRHIGLHGDAVGRIARGENPVVRTSTAEATAVAYRQLSRTPGRSVRARFLAAGQGWHGPLAWDDIDNPAAVPETCPQQLQLTREQQAALRRAEIEHLDRFGVPAQEIAARLGIADSTVLNIVAELRTGTRRDRSKETAA